MAIARTSWSRCTSAIATRTRQIPRRCSGSTGLSWSAPTAAGRSRRSCPRRVDDRRHDRRTSGMFANPRRQIIRDIVQHLRVVADVPFVIGTWALPVSRRSHGHLLPLVAEETNHHARAVTKVGRAVAHEARLPRRHQETRMLVADVDGVALGEDFGRGTEGGGLGRPVAYVDETRSAHFGCRGG